MGQYDDNSKKLTDDFKCVFCSSEQNLSDDRDQFKPNKNAVKKILD